MLLIDGGGVNLGVVLRDEALRLAYEAELDLVIVSSNGDVPTCRLLDYSKQRYLDQKHQREMRSKSAHSEAKIVQFKVRIGEHDYEFKRNHVIKFLKAGLRVQAQIFFRGREQSHPELGQRILDRLILEVAEFGSAARPARAEGRVINLIIEPNKKHEG